MGVCSALFELGGMTIMHDASGCNSTYTTHDEPRWFDMDSMVYISALTEMEAIMGDDEKLLGDIEEAASAQHPKFVAIAGTPIPTMTGFDFESVALLAESRTGLPCMGFSTTGMNTYIHGASMAFEALAQRFVEVPSTDNSKKTRPHVNVLGLTPLDFSINGQDRSIVAWLEEIGFDVVSTWGMSCTLEDISRAAEADVNLVVSASGIAAANVLYERFGIPYAVGLPIGTEQKQILADILMSYAQKTENVSAAHSNNPALAHNNPLSGEDGTICLIGEAIASLALANAIELGTQRDTKVLCTTEPMGMNLREKDSVTPDEEDITEELKALHKQSKLAAVIADPLYKPIIPEGVRFISLPSEAFSGRLYRNDIPNLIENFDTFLDGVL